MRFDSASAQQQASGELIAVGADSLLLLSAGQRLAIPTSAIGSAVIEIREDTLTGASHRFRPVVLVRPPAHRWKRLARFARFPQGLPAGADSLFRRAAAAAGSGADGGP